LINLGQLKHIATVDPRLYEVLSQLVKSQNMLNNLHGLDTSGIVTAPPDIGSLVVTAANGVFRATITDRGAVNKGITYFLEHDVSASFLTPVTVNLGPSRNWLEFLGSGNFFFRAYSQYPLSPPSAKILSTPAFVAGGGAIAGPNPQPSPGSGTSPLPGSGYGGDPTQPPTELRSPNRGHIF